MLYIIQLLIILYFVYFYWFLTVGLPFLFSFFSWRYGEIFDKFEKKSSIITSIIISIIISDLDNLDNLPWDPSADRKKISEYNANQTNEVIQKYFMRGLYQPHGHIFKQSMIGGVLRRLNPAWFDQFLNWLE